MDILQQKKVQQQAPTMEEVQNIIKLQRSIVMADILKVKPEMGDPVKYNAALKEATALALHNIYHAKRDQQVAASDREDGEDAAQPYVKVHVNQSTEYLITIEVDGGREVANPLYRNIAQCVRNFGRGSHNVSKKAGPSYKKKVKRPAPVQQSSSRPAKRARY